MRLFISQPMNGKTEKEILARRNEIIKEMKNKYGEDLQVINSFIKYVAMPGDINKSLWYLGMSIQYLAKADIAYFDYGWEKVRGCMIEHTCAVEYGIKHIITKETIEISKSNDE